MDSESDIGRTIHKQLEGMPEDERIAYLLLWRYCEEYDAVFGAPYWEGRNALLRPAEHPAFKTFVGLKDYLRGRGVAIGSRDLPWQGYVRFALESFKALGQVPCPAQLRNPVLLRKYIQSAPKTEDVGPIQKIDYSKIVDPAYRDPATLRMLGLA